MSFLHFGKSTLGQLPHVVGAVVSDDKNAGSDHDQTMLPKTGLVIVGDDDVDDVAACSNTFHQRSFSDRTV